MPPRRPSLAQRFSAAVKAFKTDSPTIHVKTVVVARIGPARRTTSTCPTAAIFVPAQPSPEERSWARQQFSELGQRFPEVES